MTKEITVTLLAMLLLNACSSQNTGNADTPTAHAPVQISHVLRGTISDSVSLSAMTFYLSHSQITAPVSGYITKAGLKPGDRVQKNQDLFNIKTREARALETNSESSPVPALGTIIITSPSGGILSSVSHVENDYVQEGAVLAQLVQSNNFYLKLFVPNEYSSVIKQDQQINVTLPDGRQVSTVATGRLNQADQVSQSVVWLLKPERPVSLPEGLNMTVPVAVTRHENTQLLPKDAVLTDESLQSFWVMKAVHDSLAVKVPVIKGIETPQKVEILEPQFSPADSIIINGHYGLEDSSKVQIEKPALQ